jgi:FKBP-type peptidyl-prolyl cis-trans isomerase FklB
MRIAVPFAVVLLAAQVAPALAADAPPPADEAARAGYALGYQIGGDLREQGLDVKADALAKGIADGLAGTEPAMKSEEIQNALMELKRKMVAAQEKQASEQNAKLAGEAKSFLETNAKEPGVATTASGLQYRVVEPGNGKTPEPADQVTVNYKGTLIDGTEFDSSYSRNEPTSFTLDGVIPGWTEGLQLVKEGGKIKLFVPPDLAYGDSGPLAGRVLIFDVELLAVGQPEQSADAPAAGASK